MANRRGRDVTVLWTISTLQPANYPLLLITQELSLATGGSGDGLDLLSSTKWSLDGAPRIGAFCGNFKFLNSPLKNEYKCADRHLKFCLRESLVFCHSNGARERDIRRTAF